MLKKTTFQILVLISISLIYGNQDNKSALEVIYEKRMLFKDYLNGFVYRSSKGEMKQCKFASKALFLSLIDKPFSEWEKHEGKILGLFIKSCRMIGAVKQNKGYLINNKLYVEILNIFS